MMMIEKFIIRQPPIGEKDDYDSENSMRRKNIQDVYIYINIFENMSER